LGDDDIARPSDWGEGGQPMATCIAIERIPIVWLDLSARRTLHQLFAKSFRFANGSGQRFDWRSCNLLPGRELAAHEEY
jgi:hypothetical protein